MPWCPGCGQPTPSAAQHGSREAAREAEKSSAPRALVPRAAGAGFAAGTAPCIRRRTALAVAVCWSFNRGDGARQTTTDRGVIRRPTVQCLPPACREAARVSRKSRVPRDPPPTPAPAPGNAPTVRRREGTAARETRTCALNWSERAPASQHLGLRRGWYIHGQPRDIWDVNGRLLITASLFLLGNMGIAFIFASRGEMQFSCHSPYPS